MICYLSRNYKGVDSAGNKAKTDVEQIMEAHGFRNVGLEQTRYTNVILAFCVTLFSVLKSVFCLSKGDVVILQYPLKKYYTFVCNIVHWRGGKVITLIHDLGSFRSKRLTISQEISRLNHSDCIIVHSEAMKLWLIENGIKAKLQILEVFDYLSESQPMGKDVIPTQPFRVLFAGVLSSCHNDFLYKMADITSRTYELVFYGGGFEVERLNTNVDYKGFVSSDKLIASAEGDFGLVWYGPTLEGGGGPLGEYLQYNAPHKLSLYIRCGLPVIIWNKAALAPFVEKNNIGVCISSLAEVEEILAGMDINEYMQMKRNVLEVGEKLSDGFYFLKSVQEACQDLNVDFG
ncbi:galactofuranosyltransferase [Bacteroides congonensis]|uniref:galactofuranosyltransferase n=1 Tax=Bacteroides congonensis TaxID=1871006 RepID=UPI0009350FD5|nr:galactofuranosyltransferase [Bacteroides congonensis]